MQYVQADHEDVIALILAEIDDYISTQPKSIFLPASQHQITVQAEAVADAFIRPILHRDKGDVEIVSWENNNLYVRFLGHCAGCPLADNTLKNVVAQTLQRYLPDVQKVLLKE